MASGNVHGIKNTMLPCPAEAFDTLQRICKIAPDAQVSVGMNCMLDPRDNTIRGWHCKLTADTSIQCVPFAPNMFEGITVVETLATESQILDLLKHRDRSRRTLEKVACAHRASKVASRVSWERCRPNRSLPLQRQGTWNCVMKAENLAKYMTVDGTTVTVSKDVPLLMVPDDTVPNFLDSASWEPELGLDGFLGLYHQWYTAASNSGNRELKLYIVCQSSCQKAGLEIKQLINDIPYQTTVGDLARSEEIWWLNNANIRNRNRLILKAAQALKVSVPMIEDYHANEPNTLMAQPCAHSFLHALYTHTDNSVSVTNECIPTSLIVNGAVCRMAPWEGVWVFRGPHADIAAEFGTAFGTALDTFPLTAVRLNEYTEAIARRCDFVIHRSSSIQHPYWTNLHEADVAAQNAGGDSNESDDSEMMGMDLFDGENLEMQIDASSFAGVSDPDFYPVALDAWKRAKLQAMQMMDSGGGNSAFFPAASTQAIKNKTWKQSFISFDDPVVFQKLKEINWDPRYGVLKLIPLCVVTN